MKTFAPLLCILSMGLCPARAAELLWAGFDAAELGSIANQPGWTAAAWLNTQTAQVSAARSFSPANALELPWHADGSSALYTNFLSTYDPANEHPVIRWSARLSLDNTNTLFQIGLRNSAAGKFLSFQNSPGRGSFGFNHAAPGFIPLVTGSFIDATAWYNRSSNTYRFDYDNAASVLWGPTDDPVHPHPVQPVPRHPPHQHRRQHRRVLR
jgi:hypothetical protein